MQRLILLALLIGLSGCAQQPAVENPLDVAAVEYARLFDAGVIVLRREGFRVDRRDYRFGSVTSKPLGSPTLLEPWRPDNRTAELTAASTFNDLRRIVTVRFEPFGPEFAGADDAAATQPGGVKVIDIDAIPRPTAYLMHVEVAIERFQVPTRHLSGTTSGPRVLGSLWSVPAELREQGVTGSYWLPVGRDTALEQALIRDIVRESLKVQ